MLARRFVLVVLTLACSPTCLAQTDDWPMERIVVRPKREFRGLLLEKTERQLEFAEIVRPRGKPMYAIIHAIPSDRVTTYESLKGEERAKLLERFQALRNRALIEAGRMEAVQLSTVQRDGVDHLLYDGPWFTMLSAADEQTTRRCIVRIEQTFRAYRQMLPPRIKRFSSFQIILYGSSAEYRAALDRWQVEIEHPAFYSPERNIIVAGTDLDRFAAELAKSVEENERTLKQLRGLKSSHEQTLAQIASDMKKNGFSPDDIELEIRSRRSAWKQQQAKLKDEVEQAKWRNAEKFEEVSRAMFRRLNHEAFHAYLENYVYPHNEFNVPRWLNEGLAQVFENAQLDADTLRVDAPARALLPKLQADLKSREPLPLKELLSSDDSLVSAHRSNNTTRRRYLYAWGLAYYLAFHRDGLGTKEFEAYIAKQSPASPVARFERWVDLPLAEFEQQWRKEMLQLR
jgi:hypothetical protein